MCLLQVDVSFNTPPESRKGTERRMWGQLKGQLEPRRRRSPFVGSLASQRFAKLAPRTRPASRADSFSPPANVGSYRDLLIFEERLKQNAERLQKQRRKYEAFLISLIIFIAYLGYTVLILPSIYSLVHYGNVALLLVSLVTLGLFFATGMYSEKIAYAYKFVPQANRALRPLNVYLNTRHRSRFSFLNFFRFTSTPSSPVVTSASRSTSQNRNTTTSIATPTPGTDIPAAAPLRRTSSSSSHSSISSIRSANALRSPPASRSPSPPAPESAVTRAPPSPPPATSPVPRGVPIPPIPPAQNPRGEIIFSSRVPATFREGYERYRGEWERRRAEAAQLAHGGKRSWWKWGRKGEKGSSGSEKENHGASVAGGTGEKRGRRTSTPGGSRAPSRQPSPFRATHRTSISVASVTSTISTPASSRAPSPDPASLPPIRRPSGGSEKSGGGSGSGRVRAESFSALLETMDEGRPGVAVVDFVPNGVSGNG